MTTVPGPLFSTRQRWFLITAMTLLVLAALIAGTVAGWPAPGLVVPAIATALLIGLVVAPLEALLGPVLAAAGLALAASLAFLIPRALEGTYLGGGPTLLMAGLAFQGLALGVAQGAALRPLCFLPGGAGQVSLPWMVSAALCLGALGLAAGMFDFSIAVDLLLGLAGGVLLGVVLRTAGLAREPAADPAQVEQEVRSGIDRVTRLLDLKQLPKAQRQIETLKALAPQDAAVRQLRYAVWKFEPKTPQFHAAAGTLLARPEHDGGSRDEITALYKDYLAVAQGQPELPTDLHIALGHRFAEWDVTDQAANIVNLYIQREPSHKALPRAMLALAEAYQRAENPSRASYFADTLLTLMPTTSEAHLAQRLLRKVESAR
ncbi:MAG: hypothetical protein AAGA23_15390 [Pseudomonadota bacterium]